MSQILLPMYFIKINWINNTMEKLKTLDFILIGFLDKLSEKCANSIF